VEQHRETLRGAKKLDEAKGISLWEKPLETGGMTYVLISKNWMAARPSKKDAEFLFKEKTSDNPA